LKIADERAQRLQIVLAYKSARARLESLRTRRLVVVVGDNYYFRQRTPADDLPRRRQPVHNLHRNVHQYPIWTVLIEETASLLAVRALDDLRIEIGDQTAEQFLHQWVVFSN
jgi:hypothetical protein